MTDEEKRALQEMIDLLLKMNDEDKREALAVLNGIQIGKQLAQSKEPA